jgi:hypothetical protein
MPSADVDQSQVTIQDIEGGIHESIIAGRDARRTRIRQVIVNVLRGPTSDSLEQRNRRAMLNKVKSFWVEGVLEKSLHGLAMIELGLQSQADAVNPLNMVLRHSGQRGQDLSLGTNIVDVFDDLGRAMLILGEPGSGKTTMLLELARATIARADQDPSYPIPVVLNLSSWSAGRKPIGEWVMDELRVKYQVPPEIRRAWMQDHSLLLLLDGLDEVKAEHRDHCVRALNEYSHACGLRDIVVCSRVADYEALTNRLELQGAILLQPLTAEQVDAYLRQAGDQMSSVRTLLDEDNALRQLTRTPLTLSVITLAYRGKSRQELWGFASIRERRAHLFGMYVDRMFRRAVRTKRDQYPREQTTNGLAWLAERMLRRGESMFLVEHLQPSWLSVGPQSRAYTAMTSLVYGVITGGLVALLFGLLWSWPAGLASGLGIGLLYGTVGARHKRMITPVELIKWSWPGLNLPMLGFWVLLSLISGAVVGAMHRYSARTAIIVGLFVGVLFWLWMTIGEGLKTQKLERTNRPNQGIWQSARNGLVSVVLWFTLWLVLNYASVFLLGWLTPEAFHHTEPVWITRLLRLLGFEWRAPPALAIVALALLLGFLTGGLWPVVQHFILRLILRQSGILPWDTVRFLDDAADRIFLRKVGGAYIFVHRSLQEHFAGMRAGD